MKRQAAHIFGGVVVMLLLARSATAVEYTGRKYRDPFADPRQAPISTTSVDTAAQQERQLAATPVQGILYSTEQPKAIVGGKIVRVGSKVGPGEVSRIDRDGVAVVFNNKEFVLKSKGGGDHGAITKNRPTAAASEYERA